LNEEVEFLESWGLVMIEVYHFITPLSDKSYQAAQRLQAQVAGAHAEVVVRTIPVHNLQVTKDIARELAMLGISRSLCAEISYQMALDFKAAQLQGNKLAQAFMLALQARILGAKAYTAELVQAAVQAVGLDYPTFLEERETADLMRAFQADQHLAREMQITTLPATVVYDTASDGPAVRYDEFSNEPVLIDSILQG
jgi:hypothetical protein